MMAHRLSDRVFLAGCLLAAIAAADGSVPLHGQERTRVTTFEVVSIKPSASDSTPMTVSATPGRFTATNIDVKNLITVAYRLPWFRIVGAPGWPERYDVVAAMPEGADSSALGAMLQNLLAERFMMQAHMEAREQPVYALVTARSDTRLGPQLHPAGVDCAVVNVARTAPAGATAAPPASDHCDGQVRTIGHAVIRGMPLDALANYLSGVVQDRVVVNRTGLEGHFDLDLQFEPPNRGSTGSVGELPSLFTALQEQLGLELEPQQGQVDVLVVDSIVRPSPN